MNLRNEIQRLAKDGRWYQDIPFGVPVPLSNLKQRESQFYHANKWEIFIRPLLIFEDFGSRNFLEIGCNAGLHLLKAAELGFRHVVGVEPDRHFYDQACFVRDYFGLKDVQLLKRIIGEPELNIDASGVKPFSIKEILVNDVVLLANVLYWLTDASASQLVKDLSRKTLFTIVVTTEDATGLSSGSSDRVKKLFLDDWWPIKVIRRSEKGDPVPRKLTATLFKSKFVAEFDVHQIWDIALSHGGHSTSDFFTHFSNFARLAFENKESLDNRYFQYLTDRGGVGDSHGEEEIKRHVSETGKLCRSIKNYGLKEPIQFFGGPLDPINGYHRLVILRELSYKKILCQVGVEEIR